LAQKAETNVEAITGEKICFNLLQSKLCENIYMPLSSLGVFLYLQASLSGNDCLKSKQEKKNMNGVQFCFLQMGQYGYNIKFMLIQKCKLTVPCNIRHPKYFGPKSKISGFLS
jgi:hypothetical protein